jgi:hypothetical protein
MCCEEWIASIKNSSGNHRSCSCHTIPVHLRRRFLSSPLQFNFFSRAAVQVPSSATSRTAGRAAIVAACSPRPTTSRSTAPTLRRSRRWTRCESSPFWHWHWNRRSTPLRLHRCCFNRLRIILLTVEHLTLCQTRLAGAAARRRHPL